MEDKKQNEAEDTTNRFICGQSFAKDGNEKELKVQKRFVSVIRCHDQCTMDLLNQAVTKHRKVQAVYQDSYK